MVIPAERVVSGNTSSGRRTKRPEYDLPPIRGDKLELPPLVDATPALPTNDQHTVVDLFCGAGGMSLGFESAGFRTLLGVDFDQWACQTFAANIPARMIVQDLNEVTDFRAFFAEHGIYQVTGIIGGPPCQGFSRVGRGRIRHRDRLKGHTGLQEDPRNRLYHQYLAAVAALRPLFFVMENVPDLAHYEDDNGLLADHIQAEFERLDYSVDRGILLASDFGVPQSRSRLFFVGLHQSLGKAVCWPDYEAARKLYGVQSLRAAIGDLPIVADGHLARCIPYEGALESWLHRWYRGAMPEDQEHLLFDHLTRPHREDDKKIFRGMKEGQRYVDIKEADRRYRSDIFRDKYVVTATAIFILRPSRRERSLFARLRGYRVSPIIGASAVIALMRLLKLVMLFPPYFHALWPDASWYSCQEGRKCQIRSFKCNRYSPEPAHLLLSRRNDRRS